MFDDIPELYRNQTADDPEEGFRYTQGDKEARRPPELLTRDHVARCILREVEEGRGSPHGGVFLDIAWIKKRIPKAAEHIKKKLPSMYHQFKQLADIDITREPMEVGPTTHYTIGRHSGRSRHPDELRTRPLCSGRMRHRATRRQPTGRKLALRSAGFRKTGRRVCRALLAGRSGRPTGRETSSAGGPRSLLDLLPTPPARPNLPTRSNRELQVKMQDLVGIVRTETKMRRALTEIEQLRRRAHRVRVPGNREYNNGWHTALELPNLLLVSEAITLSALEREGEPRSAFSRRSTSKEPPIRASQHHRSQGR